MLETNKVMICKYAPRANSPPKLAVLTPHISSKLECLYINILPTVEDIRDYQFENIKECTKEQEQGAENFIRSLDLVSEEEGESLKPQTTFNPVLQYFYQCLEFRALNPDNPLPQLDENIAA
jgi:ATP-dependent DNA helicase 2 subunit 2